MTNGDKDFEPGEVGDTELGVPGSAEPLPDIEPDERGEVNGFEEQDNEEGSDDGGS